ncbi:hypothetical protein ACFL6D_03865 [Spirochaetota bacterium]
MGKYKLKIIFKSGHEYEDKLSMYTYSSFRELLSHDEVQDIEIYE